MILSYILTIISMFLFSLNSVFVKKINLSLIHKLFITFLILVSLSFITIKFINPSQDLKIFDMKTSLISGSYFLQVLFLFIAYTTLPVSISLPLMTGAAVIFFDVFNIIINKAKLTVTEWILNVVTIIGIVLISYTKNTGLNKYFLLGIVSSLLWSVLDPVNMILTKKYAKDDKSDTKKENTKNMSTLKKQLLTSSVEIFNLNKVGLPILTLIIIALSTYKFSNVPTTLFHKENLTSNEIGSFIFYQVLTYYPAFPAAYYGLNTLNDSVFGILSTLTIPFGIMMGKIFFNETIGLKQIIGGIIIMIGVITKTYLLSRKK
jgi:drug/metabolite transporter (DMT)-like permease